MVGTHITHTGARGHYTREYTVHTCIHRTHVYTAHTASHCTCARTHTRSATARAPGARALRELKEGSIGFNTPNKPPGKGRRETQGPDARRAARGEARTRDHEAPAAVTEHALSRADPARGMRRPRPARPRSRTPTVPSAGPRPEVRGADLRSSSSDSPQAASISAGSSESLSRSRRRRGAAGSARRPCFVSGGLWCPEGSAGLPRVPPSL